MARNCEVDSDSLLVNILAKATSDCRAGRAHRAAATATALMASLVGDGVDLDDEGCVDVDADDLDEVDVVDEDIVDEDVFDEDVVDEDVDEDVVDEEGAENLTM